MRDNRNLFGAVVVAIVLLMAVALLGGPADVGVQAAEITPVASVNLTSDTPRLVTFWDDTVLNEDTASGAIECANFELIDLQHIVDETEANTTTFTIEYSNDGATWESGPAFASAVAADDDALDQYALFGKYVRLYANVTNTEDVTVTAIGVLK